MKTGTSSLNPYAASYVPLSKRSTIGENKVYSTGDAAIGFGPHSENAMQNQMNTLKGSTFHDFYGSSSQSPKEDAAKQAMDDDFDMDLAYLQMTFPGISEESLSDVYLANKRDLEATIDMLSQLEQIYPGDTSENLPETLDIGDVSESGTSGECASLKLKKVAGEDTGSGSSSSEAAVVT